eukprot:4016-Heterococcus_DN1.PRE.1
MGFLYVASGPMVRSSYSSAAAAAVVELLLRSSIYVLVKKDAHVNHISAGEFYMKAILERRRGGESPTTEVQPLEASA